MYFLPSQVIQTVPITWWLQIHPGGLFNVLEIWVWFNFRNCSGARLWLLYSHLSAILSPPQIQHLDNPNSVAISCIKSTKSFLVEAGKSQSLYCWFNCWYNLFSSFNSFPVIFFISFFISFFFFLLLSVLVLYLWYLYLAHFYSHFSQNKIKKSYWGQIWSL